MLLGSSILPSDVYIGELDGHVQLGNIVRRAFIESKLTADEWNNLPAIDREIILVKTVYAMRSELASLETRSSHYEPTKRS
jgi:hypothetical protein